MNVARLNITALNAHRNVKNTGLERRTVATRLASGLRINSAADDAAGLAISQNMQAQIRGLNQALRNISYGINFITTAEGLAHEMTSMLHRIRELSVQSSNDTYTFSDRHLINEEVRQLVREMDSLANKVTYNGMFVGQPSYIVDLSAPEIIPPKLDIVFVIDNTNTMASSSGMMTNVINNLNTFVSSLGTTDVRYGLVTYGLNTSNPSQQVRKMCFDRLGTTTGAAASSTLAATREWTDDPTELVSALQNARSNTFGGANRAEPGLEALMDPNFGASSYTSSSDRQVHYILISDQNLIHTEGTGTGMTSASNAGTAGGAYSIHGVANTLNAAGITLTVVYNGDAGHPTSIGGLTFTGGAYSMHQLAAETSNRYAPDGTLINGSIDGTNPSFSEYLNRLASSLAIGESKEASAPIAMPMYFQIGANAHQLAKLLLADFRVSKMDEKLGLHGKFIHLEVSTWHDAQEALGTVDKVLDYVLAQRVKYGACINRLEFTYRAVAISSENLEESKSRITDADMAKEMMNFAKNEMLSQAGISMQSLAVVSAERLMTLLL